MALYKLLDASSYRRLRLIEQLVSDDKWWTTETLSHLLSCSRRTLIADIQLINNNSEKNFFIQTSKKTGIKLIASDLFHIEDVYQDLVENNLNFQLIKTIIELDTTSIDNLTEILYTSESSVLRSLKQLNLFLIEYELSIQSNPVQIVGSEKQIRYFYSIFLCEYYATNLEDFEHPLKEMASNFLAQLEKKSDSEPYSFLTHYRTLIWMIVCSDRVSKGYLIEKNYLIPTTVNPDLIQLLLKLKKELPFELPKEEMNFMLYIYWNNHRTSNKNDLASSPYLATIYQNIESFVEKIKKETGYRIEENSFLITNLMGYYFYSEFFKGPSNLLFNSKRKSVEVVLKPFLNFVKTVQKIIKSYPEGTWIRDVESDSFIYVLIVYWKGLATQVLLNKEKIQISIVSYVGVQQELFLGELLSSHFPTLLECHAASDKRTTEKDCQLVLIDHKVKWSQQTMDKSKKVIGINMIPTKRDFKRVENAIKKIQMEQENN